MHPDDNRNVFFLFSFGVVCGDDEADDDHNNSNNGDDDDVQFISTVITFYLNFWAVVKMEYTLCGRRTSYVACKGHRTAENDTGTSQATQI